MVFLHTILYDRTDFVYNHIWLSMTYKVLVWMSTRVCTRSVLIVFEYPNFVFSWIRFHFLMKLIYLFLFLHSSGVYLLREFQVEWKIRSLYFPCVLSKLWESELLVVGRKVGSLIGYCYIRKAVLVGTKRRVCFLISNQFKIKTVQSVQGSTIRSLRMKIVSKKIHYVT